MSDICRLPLTVELAAGESAMSLASRLARRNGVPRMLTFCSDLGLKHKALTNGDCSEVVRLSNLANCDTDAMLFWTPKLGKDGYFCLGSEKLKFTCFDRTHVRACPLCIAGNDERQDKTGPAHLGIWQLTSIRTCHQHQCMLIDLPGPANRSDIFDYSRILDHEGSTATVSVSKDDQKLENWLLSRVENGAGSGWLDGLPVHVALQTCENFGLLVAFGPKIARSKISAEQWLKGGAAGFNILKDGPDALTKKLKSIQRLTPVDSRQYRERYGIFFNWLRDRNDDSSFDGIRDLVREFIWTNFPVPKGGSVLGEECPESYIHTPRTASKAFDVSSWKIEQRLVQLGFADKPVGARRPIMEDYPDIELIQRVVRDIRGLWSAKKAKDFLGVEAATLLLFVKAGWLSVEMKLGTKVPYYNEETITAFLQRFRTQCIFRDTHVGDAASLSKIASRCQCSLEEMLSIVFDERLPLVADDPETAQFHDFSISLADVRAVAATNTGVVCTLSEAADLIYTDTRTIRALISHGHLSTVSPFSKSRHQRWHIVSKASITEFDKQFISLRALSELRGKMPNSVSRQLAKDAIFPIALKAKTQRVFRRCDVL